MKEGLIILWQYLMIWSGTVNLFRLCNTLKIESSSIKKKLTDSLSSKRIPRTTEKIYRTNLQSQLEHVRSVSTK